MVMHQTIFGNYPMVIRWKAHRYLLGQSFGFYQDEFAGRVATKMMQTALGVRETVTKILDVLIYVVVYFIGALVLVAALDVLDDAALPGLAGLLCPAAALLPAADAAYLGRAVECALDHDGPGGRQLHQHHDGEAFRPCRAARKLCARGDG
jgi:ABC-type multidrug transport system fused ATPase/permease subunit